MVLTSIIKNTDSWNLNTFMVHERKELSLLGESVCTQIILLLFNHTERHYLGF